MPAADPPAGLARRLAAGCYDLLLLGAILMATSYALIIARGGAPVAAGAPAYQAFLLLQCAAFYAGFWAWRGQTLGMRTWRIRVETTAGATPGLGLALLRFAAALLSLAALGLGMLWILVDPDRRAWHDRVSGTRVVCLPRAT